MDITVNCAKSLGKLDHFWRSTGFTPANMLLNADMQQAMTYIGAIPHGGVTWVRIHYLLELVMAEGLDTDSPTYDWSRLDTALDALVRNGLRPFFELMGNVEGYFDDYTDEQQARAWQRLIRDLARHLIERYGREEIRSWVFETWNEPDVGFWKQSDAAFCVYVDACAAGLAEADSELKFGGPGTCQGLSSTFKVYLAHADAKSNSVTGGTNPSPAFISMHVKGVQSHPEDLTPNSMSIIEREAEMVDYIRENYPDLDGLPVINNECDPQVGWGTIHTWRARPYYVAIAAKIINQHIVKLIDEKGVNYGLLSNDNGFLGTWGHRTLLARFSTFDHIDHGQSEDKRDVPRYEEDPRRRRFELIKKPIFSLMTLLSLLGDERCEVSGVPNVAESLGVIATVRGVEQVAILIYNSSDEVFSSSSEPITLKITDIPFRRAALTYYRIDDKHGDPFKVWERMGAPKALTPEQYAELRKHQELTTMASTHDVTIQNGVMTTRFDQPLPGVTLVLLTHRPERLPKKVTGLRYERYEGMTDQEEILLIWDGLDTRTLSTYEVHYAPDADGPFTRINGPDQLDTAYLHVADSVKGFYRVRAKDYWQGTGEPSDVIEVD
ncbi:MAG: GH39 family glycosyl hydrolase [Anaerolineae bacterium]